MHVREPTHRKGHTLDVLLTRENDEQLVRNIIVKDLGVSDHLAITFTIDVVRPDCCRKKVSFRKLHEINISDFQEEMNISFSQAPELSDVNHLVQFYNATIHDLINTHAPLCEKEMRLRPNSAWYSDAIRKAKREKRRRERAWRKSKLEVHRQCFHEQCQLVNAMLLDAKTNFYTNKIQEIGNDQKKLFAAANTLLHFKNETKLPVHVSSFELAERFSTFFEEKIVDIRRELSVTATRGVSYLEHCQRCPCEFLHFSVPSDEVVKSVIVKAASKHCDLDPAPSWLLKLPINALLPVVSRIVTWSLESSTVPDEFKVAQVSPLLKKAGLDTELLSNYRPVSNLAFMSKIIEKVVAQQLTSYLNENNLDELLQSSYKKGHSVETALLKVQSDIMLATDVGLVVVQVLLDLSAACDTIDHSILLHRLKYRFGVSGLALEWFASYLSERYQYIRIGKLTSSKRQISSGVPQGSVLGPLLFTMYISPLGDVIRKHGINFHMYADDVQLYISFRPCDQMKALHELQHCLDEVDSWLRQNRLLLNGNKTKMITFGTKQRLTVATNIHVTVDGCLIYPDATTKNLGIVYDSTLSMEHQVNAVCRGAYLRLHNISRIRRYITEDATKTLIQAFVISKLDCGNALLTGVSCNLLRKLQRVQNMAARVITFTPRR